MGAGWRTSMSTQPSTLEQKVGLYKKKTEVNEDISYSSAVVPIEDEKELLFYFPSLQQKNLPRRSSFSSQKELGYLFVMNDSIHSSRTVVYFTGKCPDEISAMKLFTHELADRLLSDQSQSKNFYNTYSPQPITVITDGDGAKNLLPNANIEVSELKKSA